MSTPSNLDATEIGHAPPKRRTLETKRPGPDLSDSGQVGVLAMRVALGQVHPTNLSVDEVRAICRLAYASSAIAFAASQAQVPGECLKSLEVYELALETFDDRFLGRIP